MATAHPSLNGQGYSTDPYVIADEIFASSIYSRTSQSDLYFGQIISLDEMIKDYSNDPDGLCGALNTNYATLFGRHFTDVRVNSTPELTENEDTFNVTLKIRYSRDGATYDFSRIIENYNGVLKQVLKVLNND